MKKLIGIDGKHNVDKDIKHYEKPHGWISDIRKISESLANFAVTQFNEGKTFGEVKFMISDALEDIKKNGLPKNCDRKYRN